MPQKNLKKVVDFAQGISDDIGQQQGEALRRSDTRTKERKVININELIGEAEGIAGRYGREDIVMLLEEVAVLLRLLMRAQSRLATDDERAVIDGMLGREPVEKSAERDIPSDLRRINLAAGNLSRNVDAELTLSQLLLDLTGKWY